MLFTGFFYIYNMAIPVQIVVTQMNAALDSEGSDRYLFDLDHRPGIHYALREVQTALNSLFANTKAPAESLRELINTRIWQVNDYSRLTFNPADLNNEKLWTILSVHPEVVTIEPPVIDQTITGAQSKVRLDLTYKSSDFSCDRLSMEQWSQNKNNIFLPGNTGILQFGLKRYAYLDFSSYVSNNYNPDGIYEIEIRPDVSRKLVGMRYLRVPVMPNLITDSIEYPESLINLIVSSALSFIAWKQNNGTTLMQVSMMDVKTALGMIA